MVTMQSPPLETSPEGDQLEHRVFELTLRLPDDWTLSNERLIELGALNETCQVERYPDGGLVVTAPPPPAESGWIESYLIGQIAPWANAAGWITFGGTFGYELADGSMLVPDLSCLPTSQLPPRGDRAAWRTTIATSPPFVVETRSPGQTLVSQQRKMEIYVANGVQLSWLIDPIQRRIHVYRPGLPPVVFDDPKSLSGENVMEGLVVDLSDLWP